MSRALVETFLRQRLSSPVRLILLLFSFFVPLGMTVLFLGSLDPVGKATTAFFALIFAAGAIGQDVSSGVLQLVFARPVRRAEYVLHRWLAAGGAAAALGLLQCSLAAAMMALRGRVPENGVLFAALAENVLAAFGTAAVIVMLSSLVNGLGDLAIYFLSTTLVSIIGTAATMKDWRGRRASRPRSAASCSRTRVSAGSRAAAICRGSRSRPGRRP